jgi:hypothetical protein
LQVFGGSVTGYATSTTATRTQATALQSVTSASGNQILLGEKGSNSATSSIFTKIDRDAATGVGAQFRGSSQSISGPSTSINLNGHIEGAIDSTATATTPVGTITQERNSNGKAIKADLNDNAQTLAGQGYVSGTATFYVDQAWGGKIQSAVDAAWNGDTINSATGTYNENVVLDKSLTVNGAGQGKTTVNGNQKGSAFTIKPNVDATLSGMTITNGKADLGGGIFNNGGTLNLNNVLITANSATYNGGGIENWGGMVNMNTGSTIDRNTAGNGAGIFNDGAFKVSIVNMQGGLTANYGSGIYNDHSTVNMNTGSLIARNTATYGGGIENWGGTVNMFKGSLIAGNKATNGGGIRNYGSGTVNMFKGSSIAGNKATKGGGIYNSGTVTFKDSNSNTVATWPGYDTTKDLYGFFHTTTTPHNTPDDIYQYQADCQPTRLT